MKNQFVTVSSLDKVFPNEAPRLLQKRYSVFKNEVFHFQACCYSLEALFDCKIKIDSPIKEYVSVRIVEPLPAYLAQKRGEGDGYILKKKQSSTLYPEWLREIRPEGENVRKCIWTSFWVTVNRDEKEVLSGTYPIKIQLFSKNEKLFAECVFVLTILDQDLPASDLKYTAWIHYDCIAQQHNVEMFSPEFYAVFNRYLENAVRHGMTMLYTPLFTPPLDTAVGGERRTCQLVSVRRTGEKDYSFDFSALTFFIENAQKAGIRQFEFSHLATQWGAYHPPKIVADIGGQEKKIFGWETSLDSDEYLIFLDRFLAALAVFVEEKGLSDAVSFHISDEPGGNQLEYFKKFRNVIVKHFSGAKIMDALCEKIYYTEKVVNVPVVATDHVQDFIFEPYTERWVYYCSWQKNKFVSNRFFNMPSQRNRILGIQLYANNIKGFLHWGFNFYNSVLSKHSINPYLITDADGDFESGDCFFVYPKENGVDDSLRQEVFYDGFSDYRALKLLENLYGRSYVERVLKRNKISGFTKYKKSARWHLRFRKKINNIIIKKVKEKLVKEGSYAENRLDKNDRQRKYA